VIDTLYHCYKSESQRTTEKYQTQTQGNATLAPIGGKALEQQLWGQDRQIGAIGATEYTALNIPQSFVQSPR